MKFVILLMFLTGCAHKLKTDRVKDCIKDMVTHIKFWLLHAKRPKSVNVGRSLISVNDPTSFEIFFRFIFHYSHEFPRYVPHLFNLFRN